MCARNTNDINLTKYLGVNAPNPPNLMRLKRAPTQDDYIGIALGTLWIDTSVTPPSSLAVYMLMSKKENVAVWINFSGGGGGASEFTADAGTNPVVPDGDNNVNLFGGELINTVASLNTVTFNLDRGTNGQLPIAATGGPTTYANITSANANLTVTNGANSITLTVPDAQIGVRTLTGNTGGPIAPVANNINTVGSGLITIAGAGNTLTTKLTQGLDGQVPIAATGGPTVYANLTSSNNSITITNTPNSIDLIQNGGASSITVTIFDGNDTWTKAAGTQVVEVYGWNGGGGGGSGQRGGSVIGGGGGSNGTCGWYRFLESFVGATAAVVVGAGGAGGAAQTVNNTNGNPGANSGVSSFGNIVLVAVNNANFVSTQNSGGNGGGTANPTTGGYPQLALETIPPAIQVSTNNLLVPFFGGSGTSSTGGNAGNAGMPFGAGNFSVISDYLRGTAGGGGGGGLGANSGGNGGPVVTTDGLTTINAGGAGGVGAGGAGGAGNDSAIGAVSAGVMTGGTGGGGGASGSSIGVGGAGGNGGFPGGGGGGGGATIAGFNSGAGGNGGNGRIVVLEYA